MQVSKNSDGKSDSSESRKHKSVSQFQNLVHLTRQDEKNTAPEIMVAQNVGTFQPTGTPRRRTSLFDRYNSRERMATDTLTAKPLRSPRSPKVGGGSRRVADHSKNAAAFEDLKKNLNKYTRGSDRRMAIRSLTECRALRAIPIDGSPSSPSSQEEWKNLEREVCFTSIDLNGLLFQASSSSQILKVLTELCRELCRESRLSYTSIYQAMIVRLARTTSSADSYFQLNALLGSQDLVLQPRVAQAPPTQLMMYESDGAIHAVVTTYHSYGLFRRCDVTSGKAWIPLQAAIHERVNFTTGDSFRHVGVKVANES